MPFAPFRLLLVDPVLPAWLPELTITRLRVGDAEVAIRFRRAEHGTADFEVIDKKGELRVVRQPWLESMSADWMERMKALLDR